ncbi:hypothetical protein EP7_002421 [Isosphaeraceae bacterium EP7]
MTPMNTRLRIWPIAIFPAAALIVMVARASGTMGGESDVGPAEEASARFLPGQRPPSLRQPVAVPPESLGDVDHLVEYRVRFIKLGQGPVPAFMDGRSATARSLDGELYQVSPESDVNEPKVTPGPARRTIHAWVVGPQDADEALQIGRSGAGHLIELPLVRTTQEARTAYLQNGRGTARSWPVEGPKTRPAAHPGENVAFYGMPGTRLELATRWTEAGTRVTFWLNDLTSKPARVSVFNRLTSDTPDRNGEFEILDQAAGKAACDLAEGSSLVLGYGTGSPESPRRLIVVTPTRAQRDPSEPAPVLMHYPRPALTMRPGMVVPD